MKNFLLIAVLVMAIAACTKQKPDWDQVSCKRCISIKQVWADSAKGFLMADTVADVQLCEERLHNFENAKTDYWIKICNPGSGELLHWEFFINKTF